MTVPSGSFGILRHEIRNCLIFGLYQAALTLTNHYLERFVKVALIKAQSTQMMTAYESFTKEQETLIDEYGGQALYRNLLEARRLELITEGELAVLQGFRKFYRNTFSHFDNKEITPDVDLHMTQFSFDNPGTPLSSGKISLKSLGMDMGHLAAEFAKDNALVYFLAIDDLAMRFELRQSPGLREVMIANGIEVDRIFSQINFDTYRP